MRHAHKLNVTASEAAINQFGRTLANELAETQINVNIINPS